ncbi:2-dehydropantoate 2-reductase [Balneolaceae bacterium ANBcel3]|nr:2-dehydropantoate 2-reductase [Balneolaceae bacterium ANBcel3]
MEQILIMGSGAVGGYYGAYLADSDGPEVAFIARGAQYDAMKKTGLRITGKEERTVDPLSVYKDPALMEMVPDLVILAVKSHHTEEAIEQLKPVISKDTCFLSLQNGMENYEILSKAFGSRNVIRGFCKIGTEVTSPGVIEYRGQGALYFGEENGVLSNRILQLQKICENAGLKAIIPEDIRKEAWKKFIWNCVFNMMTGISGVTTDYIFKEEEAYTIAWQIFYEIQAIAGAGGVRISDEEGEDIIDASESLGAFLTSTAQDRRKGKRLEYDTFCGYVVRKADHYELEASINRSLYAQYRMIDMSGC